MKVKVLLLLLVFTVVVGCAPGQMGVRKEHAGAATGAALGGLLGSQFGGDGRGKLVTTAIGVVLGGIAGGHVGRTMDKVDQMEAERALRQGLSQETGYTHHSQWQSRTGEYHAEVTPKTEVYRTNDGRECRRFDQQIVRNGEPLTRGEAIACREPDGWRIVER